jgi:DNA-binding GntR family transcriptional regulator
MSLTEGVYNRIKELIILGEFSPGEKLSEIELAQAMKVSRTPIREAFRQLERAGYITFVSNKGAYVSKLAPEEIEEIYNVVSLLEGYAAELAAKAASSSQVRHLKKLQKELSICASRKKYREYIEKNTVFHRYITELTGNRTLVKTINDLRHRVYRYRFISITIPGFLKRYASDHEKIIDAIQKRDSPRARRCMIQHVSFVKEVLVGFLKEQSSIGISK